MLRERYFSSNRTGLRAPFTERAPVADVGTSAATRHHPATRKVAQVTDPSSMLAEALASVRPRVREGEFSLLSDAPDAATALPRRTDDGDRGRWPTRCRRRSRGGMAFG